MFPDIFDIIFHKRSKSHRALIFQVENRHRRNPLNPLVYVLEVLKKPINRIKRNGVGCTKLTLQSLTPTVIHNIGIHIYIGIFSDTKEGNPSTVVNL